MTDTPEDVQRSAEALASGAAPMTPAEAIAVGIMAERERIAIWHEQQADALDAAIEQILKEGGVIEPSHRSLADIHRGFAKAIRLGAA